MRETTLDTLCLVNTITLRGNHTLSLHCLGSHKGLCIYKSILNLHLGLLPFVTLSYGVEQISIKIPKWTKLNHGGINWNKVNQSGKKYTKMEKSWQIDHKGCFSLLATPNVPESRKNTGVLSWPPPKITESRTWVSLGAANSDSAMFWGWQGMDFAIY